MITANVFGFIKPIFVVVLSKYSYRFPLCMKHYRANACLVGHNVTWNKKPFSSCTNRRALQLLEGDISSRHCRNFSWEMTAKWIAQTQPVLMAQENLQFIHDVSNMPWWATIALTTFVMRFVVTFPLTVYQHVIMARLQNIQPEIETIAQELKRETAVAMKMYEWPKEHARYMFNKSMKKHVNNLIIRDNCHPFKSSLVVWVQLPMWISLSFAYRNLVTIMPIQDLAAQIRFLELATGGTLWFPNLTIPDASFILPICLGLVNLAIVEIHALRKLQTTRFQTVLTYFMRVMCLILVPISATVPSCMAFYWTVSSTVGLVQNVMLYYPSIRRACLIPPSIGESNTPLKELLINFKTKWKL